MATKKTDKVAVETVNNEEPKKDETERVRIIVPFIDGEDPEQVVGVNGKFYKIRKGVYVDVPAEVAEVLENSNLQMVRAREFQAEYEGKGKEFDW